jgi:putative ABC transport system permease protein
LDKHTDTIPVQEELERQFAAQLPDLEVRIWTEMSQWYRKVKSMFDVIFAFVFIIVFVIVITSVINTMSMAVIERTREIGTLRALGLKRKGVNTLFAIESVMLGFIGSLGGLVITLLSTWGVEIIKPTWVPPAITKRIPIMIFLSWNEMFFSFLILLCLCLLASLLPARRAARKNVVDALGHV